MFELEEAKALLKAAEDVLWERDGKYFIGFNDTWAWASADAEELPESEMPHVATLFWRYGWCGLLYWASERNDKMRSEFQDINRFIEFVRHEEEFRAHLPESNKRAYEPLIYALGESR